MPTEATLLPRALLGNFFIPNSNLKKLTANLMLLAKDHVLISSITEAPSNSSTLAIDIILKSRAEIELRSLAKF